MRATPLMLAALTLVAGSARLGAQSDWIRNCERGNHDDRERHCEARESRIQARATVTVDAGQNGGVSIEGWDQSDILVEARIQTWASTEREAREIARDIRVSTSGTISATGPSTSGNRRSGWAVSYKIFVPRRTSLSVETHNGPISVEDVAGRMALRAHNGPLNLHGVSGDVNGRTQNGPINVTLAGSRWSGAGLDVETVNGPVNLRVPRNYSAELETGTVNGPINFDLEQPIPVRGRITRVIRSTLGSGGAPIRAVTTNGPVVLRNS
jgi:DUF4097 and DUF4098 domain-containing protein YvlB